MACTNAATLTDSHKIDALSTDESMELLMAGKGLKKEVSDDDALMQRIEQFVEEELGNLTISVAMLKQALKGLGVVKATETMAQFESSLVESLQDARVDRNLRGLQGTIKVLLQRLGVVCQGDTQRVEVAMQLLAMVAVLNPASVPDELFMTFEAQAASLVSGLAGLDLGERSRRKKVTNWSPQADSLAPALPEFGSAGESTFDFGTLAPHGVFEFGGATQQSSEPERKQDVVLDAPPTDEPFVASLKPKPDQSNAASKLFEDAEVFKSAAASLRGAGLVGWGAGAMRIHQLVQRCVRHELAAGKGVGLPA